MTEAVMKHICVFLAVWAALAHCNQANDTCQLKGFNLQPLSSSYWAVPFETKSCVNGTESCTLLFALCHTSALCPEGAFACFMQNGNAVKVGGEAEIHEDANGGGFSLIYKNAPDAKQRTIIEFKCDAENKFPHEDFQGQFCGLFKPQEITLLDGGHRVVIHHEIGCKKREGLGPGSQFMIIILILFLLYFLGGIAYNHVNGARGEELIPHHWFWKNLPSYVVDGCFFVVRVVTCQTRENYSQNPDYGSTSQAGVSPSGRTYETL